MILNMITINIIIMVLATVEVGAGTEGKIWKLSKRKGY